MLVRDDTYQIINNAQSGASFTTDTIEVGNVKAFVSLLFTRSLNNVTGTLAWQAANEDIPASFQTIASQAIGAGGDLLFLIDNIESAGKYMRLVWTSGGVNGAINCVYNIVRG